MMSKIMVAPPLGFSLHAIHDRWNLLYNALNEKFGFMQHETEIVDIEGHKDLRITPLSNNVDTIFVWTPPRFINTHAFLNSINKRVKLISYIIDLHSYERGKQFKALLERSDLILSMANAKFKEDWPQFIDKFVFWPAFFSPDKRFVEFTFNENPIMKCLASGSTTPAHAYPLRQIILQEAKGKAGGMIDVLPFPGTYGAKKEGAITRDAFAKLLHSYFCGITTTTAYDCVIPKTVEILAVGSLLLMNRVEDLDTMGLIPNKHYVPINQKNIGEQVAECLATPEKFKEIRLNGMKAARTHHGLDNRIKQLGSILEKLME